MIGKAASQAIESLVDPSWQAGRIARVFFWLRAARRPHPGADVLRLVAVAMAFRCTT
jgi:hypothetical protein